MQRGVKSLHCIILQGEANLAAALWLPAASCNGMSDLTAAFSSGESNLTAAWCSGESNLTPALCSGESSLKNFRGLPGPLKGQSWKKSHIGDYYLHTKVFLTFYEKTKELETVFTTDETKRIKLCGIPWHQKSRNSAKFRILYGICWIKKKTYGIPYKRNSENTLVPVSHLFTI